MGRQPRTRRLGRGEPLGWGWRIVCAVLYAPVSLAVRIRWRHIERIPHHGGVIVVVNHVSHADPLLVSKFLIDAGRAPRFLAKQAIFEVPVVGWAMRAMGHIPVRRDSVEAAHALTEAAKRLRAGACVVLHPEGTVTRDPDGWPMAGKTGAARLALLAPGVPVVPVAQWGVQEQIDLYRHKLRLFPRPRHELSVGTPIDLSGFQDADSTPEVLRAVSDHIGRRLRADVAELRGIPVPEGELFRWSRPAGVSNR